MLMMMLVNADAKMELSIICVVSAHKQGKRIFVMMY